MSNIESTATRAPFFPRTKDANNTAKSNAMSKISQRNSPQRMKSLKELTTSDAKVNINDAVKDFSRIKKVVDAAPEVDNTDKIAKLKQQINNGTYKVDYDALADKILTSEF